MSGPLNLADADLKGFDAVEPGKVHAKILEMGMTATTNPNGNLPVGTPGVAVTFVATDQNDPDYVQEGRRFWATYYIPPKDYDEKKAKTMKGMVARLFIALGDEESAVVSSKFSPDLDDYLERECVITVGKDPKKDRDTGEVIEGEYNNPVKGVKHVDTWQGGAENSGLL